MEYAILDICSLECVFKWSVSRPISGSSESILARYVSQVVSKHTKLGSRGAECCKRAETYWPEELDAKWSVIWKCLLKILLLPPSTLPFQQRKKRENILSYVFGLDTIFFILSWYFQCSVAIFFSWNMHSKNRFEEKTLYSIHLKCLRFYPRPMLKSVNLPPSLVCLVTLWWCL